MQTKYPLVGCSQKKNCNIVLHSRESWNEILMREKFVSQFTVFVAQWSNG